jgi:hypothetical protein
MRTGKKNAALPARVVMQLLARELPAAKQG